MILSKDEINTYSLLAKEFVKDYDWQIIVRNFESILNAQINQQKGI